MKTLFRMLVAAVVLLLLLSDATAQRKDIGNRTVSKLVAEKGYWVIESNLKTPKSSTIHFYTASHNLMYSEKVEGVKINIEKRRTVALLNRALLQTLLAYKEKQKQDEQLVKNMLK